MGLCLAVPKSTRTRTHIRMRQSMRMTRYSKNSIRASYTCSQVLVPCTTSSVFAASASHSPAVFKLPFTPCSSLLFPSLLFRRPALLSYSVQLSRCLPSASPSPPLTATVRLRRVQPLQIHIKPTSTSSPTTPPRAPPAPAGGGAASCSSPPAPAAPAVAVAAVAVAAAGSQVGEGPSSWSR